MLGDAGQLSLTELLKKETSEYHAKVWGCVFDSGFCLKALNNSESDLEGLSPLTH